MLSKLKVPGYGWIAAYDSDKGGFFVATCKCELHRDIRVCSIQRSREKGRKRGQGRPLGYMMAWLLQAGLPADHPDAVASRDEHVHGKSGKFNPGFATRGEARTALMRFRDAPALAALEYGGLLEDGAEPDVFTA